MATDPKTLEEMERAEDLNCFGAWHLWVDMRQDQRDCFRELVRRKESDGLLAAWLEANDLPKWMAGPLKTYVLRCVAD